MSVLVYLALVLAISCTLYVSKRRRHLYPPGPKGLPVLGSLFDIPLENPWLKFNNWAHQYDSDVIHVEALGIHIVVANSAKAAKDLFDGRPHIYNDKEQSTMALELTGWRRSWTMLPYGESWREHRKLFHQHFRPSALPQYHPKQAKAVRRLLHLLLDAPADFAQHIRYASGSAILDVVYAFDTLPGDPRIDLVEQAVWTANKVLAAGVYLVDVFPILKYLPSWLPGAQFKRDAATYKKLVDAMFLVPYQQLKEDMTTGKAKACFTTSLLSETPAALGVPEQEEMIMNLVGSIYAAGSDTTTIALSTFVLAMLLYPDAQSDVQEELDRVVGLNRLPEIADREYLPRVAALIQEVLRWHPPLPLATTHRAMIDDEYSGFHIPAGSLVLGNTWAILHDEETYPDPYTFDPKRFLTAGGALRTDVPFPMETFGYGRRICPGRHFAMDALFLAISNILAVFTIERAIDEHGKPIEVREAFTPHAISRPEPFKAHFKPRSADAEALICAGALADA